MLESLTFETCATAILWLTGPGGAPIATQTVVVQGGVCLNDVSNVYVPDGPTDSEIKSVTWAGLLPGTYEVWEWRGPLLPTGVRPRILVNRQTFQLEEPEIALLRIERAQLEELVIRLTSAISDPVIADLIRRIREHIEGLTARIGDRPTVAPPESN